MGKKSKYKQMLSKNMRTKKEIQDYLESIQDDLEETTDEKEATIMEIQIETLEFVLGG